MTDKTMTLEQALELGYRAGFISACNWPEPCSQDVDSPSFAIELRVFIEKHMPLYRQSDGPSDVVSFAQDRIAQAARGAYLKDHRGDHTGAMRAALTAVWHNRPAQEKAEPVAVIGPVWQLLWCDSESIAAIAKKHGLKVGDKLYTAPPAERVRVPFPMAESNAPDHLGPDEKQTYADGFNACRELVLSAATEATPSPTIDVAAVREVMGELAEWGKKWPSLDAQRKKLARAIGDAK